jgi:hypothetical protein
MTSLKLFVDKFPQRQVGKASIYILTHAHTDHGGKLSAKFRGVVHCTSITKYLMQSTRPDVKFVADLVYSAWSVLDMQLLVYCFDSGHCLGGIGFYCPELNILHFGDGRPTRSTISNIVEIHTLFGEEESQKKTLQTACDQYSQEASKSVKCTTFVSDTPTLHESSQILADVLRSQKNAQTKQTLNIKLAHFGSLGCLPREFGYYWLSTVPASGPTLLCQKAFELYKFKPGPIAVSYKWDTYHIEHDDANVVSIILSANWWIQQCVSSADLRKPRVDEKQNIRVYASAHASLTEIQRDFANLCTS